MRRCLDWAQSTRRSIGYWSTTRQTPLSIRRTRTALRSHRHHAFSNTAFCYELSPDTGKLSNDGILRPRWFDLSGPDIQEEEVSVTAGKVLRPFKSQWDKPEPWVALLDPYIPPDWSISSQGVRGVLKEKTEFEDVLKIFSDARTLGNIDLLAFMTLNDGRHGEAVYLANLLLRGASATIHERDSDDRLPSNIVWPLSLSKGIESPIELDYTSMSAASAVPSWESPFDHSARVNEREKVMQLILPSLAELVISSADMPSTDAAVVTSTVRQIIAHMHSSGLVQEGVYDYSLPIGTTTIQRPPILHLLSSRVLSALSDAMWRAQQDEAIARARNLGMDDKQISQEVPGGRFRRTVRELGPEVWLEFLLWCCVEGSYASAGVRIINLLRTRSDDPWYAVHWSTHRTAGGRVPQIDWDRLKRRYGGTVGQIEGYSPEEPFAHVPPRTISAEVVLSLVDCLFNSVNSGVKGSGMSVNKVQSHISDVVSFLEPHALGAEYFDFLTVRLLQSDSLYIDQQPDLLRKWSSTISHLRALETMQPENTSERDLDIDSVVRRSEVEAGLLHQVLQAYINRHNASQAVGVFEEIQRLVDAKKLESIFDFMTTSPELANSRDLSESSGTPRLEYAQSHGQLPIHKMAGFLNLITNTKLYGLGDWLINSIDIDGPLISPQSYDRLCMVVSLTKYGDAARDGRLIMKVLHSRKNSRLKPSVNTTRALVNSYISIHDWSEATLLLKDLKEIPGGGYSPRIVAHLAGWIIRFEASKDRKARDEHLQSAMRILEDIFLGDYDGRRAVFTSDVKRVFDQQIGFLLRLFENIPDTKLQDLAFRYKLKFPSSNNAGLAPETFNTVISAVVDVRGAVAGRQLWNIFCKDPRHFATSEQVPLLGDIVVPDAHGSGDGDGDEDGFHAMRTPDQMPDLTSDHVPIVARDADWASADESSKNGGPAKPSFVPIVVPNIRTLQIIVKGAVTEKRSMDGLSKTKERDLDKLLHWAATFFKAFNYSKEDVEAEIRMPVAPGAQETSHAQLKWRYDVHRRKSGLSEKNPPNIGRNFARAAPITRLPRGDGRLDTSDRKKDLSAPVRDGGSASLEKDMSVEEEDLALQAVHAPVSL